MNQKNKTMKYNPNTETVTGTTQRGTFVATVKATPNGITITNLTIESATPNQDINTTTVLQVNLTEIRDTYRKQATHNPKPATYAKPQQNRRVNTPDFLYNCAQDVLKETATGRHIRLRLANKWNVSADTVKSRTRLLRKEGWLVGGSTKTMPGPTYLHYKQTK